MASKTKLRLKYTVNSVDLVTSTDVNIMLKSDKSFLC